MKKYLMLLILMLSVISTSASAIDWRILTTKASDNSIVHVDYDSVFSKDNFLIITIKGNPTGVPNISSKATFVTNQIAISCSTSEYKELSLSENYKNGTSKSIYNFDYSHTKSLSIPNGSIIDVGKKILCNDFSNLFSNNNVHPIKSITSKLLPEGINSVDWRFLVADTNNAENFWVTTDSISNFGNGLVGFVAKFDYKTPQKLESGGAYMYMIQYIVLDCGKHTQDNVSTEFFDKNENVIETYRKETSELSMQVYKMETYAGWAEVTVCPIAKSKPVYQSSDSNQSNKSDTTYAAGTGWQISKYHLITANHVIENVDSIFVSVKEGDVREATIIASDSSNDLALIKVKTPLTTTPLALAAKQSKLGSKVAVIGYPLPDILGSKLQATSGEISSLTGLGNDIRFYQISAAVQSGNSGGPLLNQQGEVIGVISSKLNDANMLKERGELPQNVNFAVKSSYIRALIESAGIAQYKTAKKSTGIEDAIDNAKNSVYQIITSTNRK